MIRVCSRCEQQACSSCSHPKWKVLPNITTFTSSSVPIQPQPQPQPLVQPQVQVYPPPSLSTASFMETCYFESQWKYPFDLMKTRMKMFTMISQGVSTSCYLMEQHRDYEYYESLSIQMCRVAFLNERLEGMVILPKPSYASDSGIPPLGQLVASTVKRYGRLALPRIQAQATVAMRRLCPIFEYFKFQISNLNL